MRVQDVKQRRRSNSPSRLTPKGAPRDAVFTEPLLPEPSDRTSATSASLRPASAGLSRIILAPASLVVRPATASVRANKPEATATRVGLGSRFTHKTAVQSLDRGPMNKVSRPVSPLSPPSAVMPGVAVFEPPESEC
jgi:hypothetical protein